MPQTNQVLMPDVKINLAFNSSPVTSEDNNICLLGFVADASNLNSNTPVNSPIDLGNITTVAQAVSKLTDLGIQVTMTGLTTYDVTATDEIAQMLIQAVATYQLWSPYQDINTLASPRYIIGILDTDVNNRVLTTDTPAKTPYGNFFVDAVAEQLTFTTIVPSYEYQSGDDQLSNSYITELKTFVEEQINKGKPDLGFNCPIFHSNFDRTTDFDTVGFVNILRSCTFNTYQDTSDSSYQINSSAFGASCGMVIGCLPPNAEGLTFQTIPNLPAPTSFGLFENDDIENQLQNGFSPIRYNKKTSTQQFVRVVTSTLLDPDLGVPRSNMLDILLWKSAYYAQYRIYNGVVSNKKIINSRTNVDENGNLASVDEVESTVKGILVQLEEEGMLLLPKDVSSTINVGLDPDNSSVIKLAVKLYITKIIRGVDGTSTVEDSDYVLSQFFINTNS